MFVILSVFLVLVGFSCGERPFDYSNLGKEENPHKNHEGEMIYKFTPIGDNFETPFLAMKPQPKTLYNWGRDAYHGEEGINYNIEDDNRTPYIICKYYRIGNDSDTLDHVLSEDGKTTRCYMDHTMKSQKLGCYAMFNQKINPDNTTTKTLRKQGCHVQQKESIHSYCNQQECIGDEDDFPHPIFCCCNTHECNDELSDKPPIKVEPWDGKDFMKFFPDPKKRTIVVKHEEWITQDVILGISAVFIIIVVGIVVVIVVCLKFRKPDPDQKHTLASEEGTPLVPVLQKVPISSLLVNEGSFDLSNFELLSHGNVSSVFTAMLKNEDDSTTKVAVKVFPKIKQTDFAYELHTYHYFMLNNNQCDSILRFIGWMEHDNMEYRLITEYHPMGNLRNYLKENTVTVRDSFDIICSALEGLSFMHEEKYMNSVAHRDIKPSNILLKRRADNSLQAVIADFGFSQKLEHIGLLIKKHQQYSLPTLFSLGTHRYMAPELLQGSISSTISGFKSHDVYAMSLVIWETLSRTDITEDSEGTPPYMAVFEAEVPQSSLHAMKLAVYELRIQPTFRRSITVHPYLGQLALTCREMWIYEGEGRISSGLANERIKRLREEYKQEHIIAEAVELPYDYNK